MNSLNNSTTNNDENRQQSPNPSCHHLSMVFVNPGRYDCQVTLNPSPTSVSIATVGNRNVDINHYPSYTGPGPRYFNPQNPYFFRNNGPSPTMFRPQHGLGVSRTSELNELIRQERREGTPAPTLPTIIHQPYPRVLDHYVAQHISPTSSVLSLGSQSPTSSSGSFSTFNPTFHSSQ